MFVQVWWLRAGSSWQCWGPPTCPCLAPTSPALRALRKDVKTEKRKNEYQKYENNGYFHSVPPPPDKFSLLDELDHFIFISPSWIPSWNGNFHSFYIFLMWGLPQVQSGWSPPAPQTQAGLDTLNWILTDFLRVHRACSARGGCWCGLNPLEGILSLHSQWVLTVVGAMFVTVSLPCHYNASGLWLSSRLSWVQVKIEAELAHHCWGWVSSCWGCGGGAKRVWGGWEG